MRCQVSGAHAGMTRVQADQAMCLAGKTLLARAIASNIDANFLKVVSSAIVDKYIGESARLIREMFGYARDHQPCIIFMDEIDAIGGRRFSEGTSADREIQRTLMELLSQLDGFDVIGKASLYAEVAAAAAAAAACCLAQRSSWTAAWQLQGAKLQVCLTCVISPAGCQSALLANAAKQTICIFSPLLGTRSSWTAAWQLQQVL